MNPFAYSRAATMDAAIQTMESRTGAAFLAGGTTLVDLMKLDVLAPEQVVDINSVPLSEISVGGDRVRIGALARMSDVASHAEIQSRFPVIAQALLASASPQIRNMATIGGNLMQRTRCPYFRDTFWACNKRHPGEGCSALDGDNRMHAILGTSEHCIATHPSDLAVALAALDATVQVEGPSSKRSIPFEEFHLLPEDTPDHETALEHGELIVSVDVPISTLAARSRYLKVRDRASYEFALVSIAVAILVEHGTVLDCRLALGGVGTKPWSLPEAAQSLCRRKADAVRFQAAAEIALAGAKPTSQNAFKIELAKRLIVRALTDLATESARE